MSDPPAGLATGGRARIHQRTDSKPTITTRPAGHTAGLGERDDYDDRRGQRRRPWTLTQIAMLIVAVLLALPPVAIVQYWGLILLLGGMQH